MEGEEGIASAVASTAPTPSPPLLDDPGSGPANEVVVEVVEPGIQSPLSDEDLGHDHDHDHDRDHEQEHDDDHDHDHDQDHDHDHDPAPETGVSMDDLNPKIIKQVEYYFSDENLSTDKYLRSFIRKNKEGFVPISLIASFRKVKKLTRDHSFIVAALKESSLLVVSGDGKRVKRLNPLQSNEVRDPKLCTVLVENLPEDHSKVNIQRIFSEAGKVKRISIHDPHAIAESAKSSKQEMLLSHKLHAFVEYETSEAAEKAVATLNDKQDWRNGMRVKFLKHTIKYGQRKQAWKGSDSEKNSTSRVSEQTDEEHHSSNEHNEDTPDEEDGEHLSKDKSGQRCSRNRGRSRKQKYRGIHGMGHGSPSTLHAVEASKPPPGPKMPDGTRGFTMGRGRVLASAPN